MKKIHLLTFLMLSFCINSAFASLIYSTKVEIGDPWADGHGFSDYYQIKTNLTQQEILTAYSEGVKVIGFDLVADVAEEYGDNVLPREFYTLLVAADIKIDFESLRWNEDKIRLSVDEYFQIWINFVKLGNPGFQYKIVKADSYIHINGYGLFDL